MEAELGMIIMSQYRSLLLAGTNFSGFKKKSIWRVLILAIWTQLIVTKVLLKFLLSDIVLVVVDASDKRKREKLDEELMKTLTKCSHIPAILLLNKVCII